MGKKRVVTKILAIAGTVLVWAPIVFLLLTSVVGTIASGILRVDYLIPAELFPAVLAGALLLLWAAWRSRSYRKLVGFSLLAAVLFLFACQGTAVISGLASGKMEAAGPVWVLVLILLNLYSVMLVVLCIAGILLLRKLYRKTDSYPDLQ